MKLFAACRSRLTIIGKSICASIVTDAPDEDAMNEKMDRLMAQWHADRNSRNALSSHCDGHERAAERESGWYGEQVRSRLASLDKSANNEQPAQPEKAL
jgi:hypothetical protein